LRCVLQGDAAAAGHAAEAQRQLAALLAATG
jgi:hypothetical protein